MAKPEAKQAAQKLRARGVSINEIARTLGVAKSSVSLWCQDIRLTPAQQARLRKKQIASGHRGRIAGAAANKRKRLVAIEQHTKQAQELLGAYSTRDLLMLGLGLDWGEGAKSRSGGAAVTNSDPALLVVARDWFQKCFAVKENEFRPYVYISAHHSPRRAQIVSFWSHTLNLPAENFKVILLKTPPKKALCKSQFIPWGSAVASKAWHRS